MKKIFFKKKPKSISLCRHLLENECWSSAAAVLCVGICGDVTRPPSVHAKDKKYTYK